MDGLQGEAKQVNEGGAQEPQTPPAQIGGSIEPEDNGGIVRARADYEAARR